LSEKVRRGLWCLGSLLFFAHAVAPRLRAGLQKAGRSVWACAVGALCLAGPLLANAQTFRTVAEFDGSNGSNPQYVALAQGRDGNLWGTTQAGGFHGDGTIFRVTPRGALTTPYSFDVTTGASPDAGLALGRDNFFYGTTLGGGASGGGVAFKIAPTGTLTVLFSFSGASGINPEDSLTQAVDGNFYGTTRDGPTGVGPCGGCGTVFKISAGSLTTLYTFDLTPHGAAPVGGLAQATDGNFYGTASLGGISAVCPSPPHFEGCGTVFRVTPGGALTLLHRFDAGDGAYPTASLIQGRDGNLYGTTQSGGKKKAGTVFKVTLAGKLTTLYNFTGGADGGLPEAALVEGTDGNFYGATVGGGSSNTCAGAPCGTLFQITPSGVLTTLHSFSGTDGEAPVGLAQHTNGVFYGTTALGGNSANCSPSCGTVFSLDMGLGPFIKTTTTVGKVGSKVQILGQGFTGTTAVTFNGTAATTFTVEEDTFMTAVVPNGATTGPVQVTTPGGVLSSNVSFRVVP
jgi:uncharacterized repeat protein (TIGR03803 family)